jgi:hypothetical protein
MSMERVQTSATAHIALAVRRLFPRGSRTSLCLPLPLPLPLFLLTSG